MSKIVTSYNNFARGQIDQDMNGRYDLPIYTTGSEVFKDYISNFKGNLIYRTGFENLITFEDCALIEFKFSDNQNYILVLYANKMRFLSYDSGGVFGFVLDSGGPAILEVDTPWTLAESKELGFKQSFTQNFDGMILTHEDHEPRELLRLAADEFQLRTFARKDDPFVLTYDSTKVITAISNAVEPTVSIASHGLTIGDRFKIEGVVGMTEINDWTVSVVSVPGGGSVIIDLDTSGFSTYSSAGTSAEVLTGDYPSVCLYHGGRLYYAATRLKITTLFASESAFFKIHTLPAAVTAESAIQVTQSELTSRIDWLFSGQNSLILGSSNLIIAVNGGGVGVAIIAETIDSIVTSADGSNNVAPLAKDGFVFYVGNNSRRLLYFTYDLLTETFVADDANVISYDITLGGVTKIRHVKNREDLIFAANGSGDLSSCNFNVKEKIIGWQQHTTIGTINDIAQISDNSGQQQLFVLSLRDSVYYIERQAEYQEFSKRDSFFTNDKAADDEAHYRKTSEELKECIYLDNSGTLDNLQTTTITYDGSTTITDPGNPFVSGDVGKHIVYKTITGYESGRFEITGFNSTSNVDVIVLQTPTANVFSSWYLTFDTITGLSRFNGQEVAIVADGKFINTFTISGGQQVLDAQVTSAVVGYLYTGVAKAFNLGFQVQAENTQGTMKTITRVGLRCLNTGGGQFGLSRYSLNPIQELKDGDLNYLPPRLVNSTRYINVMDTSEIDKQFYIIQDIPLPMTITTTMVDVEYAFTR